MLANQKTGAIHGFLLLFHLFVKVLLLSLWLVQSPFDSGVAYAPQNDNVCSPIPEHFWGIKTSRRVRLGCLNRFILADLNPFVKYYRMSMYLHPGLDFEGEIVSLLRLK